jgi:hypothetical protein
MLIILSFLAFVLGLPFLAIVLGGIKIKNFKLTDDTLCS